MAKAVTTPRLRAYVEIPPAPIREMEGGPTGRRHCAEVTVHVSFKSSPPADHRTRQPHHLRDPPEILPVGEEWQSNQRRRAQERRVQTVRIDLYGPTAERDRIDRFREDRRRCKGRCIKEGQRSGRFPLSTDRSFGKGCRLSVARSGFGSSEHRGRPSKLRPKVEVPPKPPYPCPPWPVARRSVEVRGM